MHAYILFAWWERGTEEERTGVRQDDIEDEMD